jgi:hypothetical protein
MLLPFEQDGVSFRYPAQWKLEQEDNASGWTVLLQSPGTSFVTITLDTETPPLEQVLETALAALQSDYPTLEAEPWVESLAGQPAIGHNMQFFALDLITTCCTRCFHCEEGAVLVLYQADDLELEQTEPVFRAILASLRVDE